jgi:hypothetical protein
VLYYLSYFHQEKVELNEAVEMVLLLLFALEAKEGKITILHQ